MESAWLSIHMIRVEYLIPIDIPTPNYLVPLLCHNPLQTIAQHLNIMLFTYNHHYPIH